MMNSAGNHDSSHTDFRTFQAMNISECCDACNADHRCKAFTVDGAKAIAGNSSYSLRRIHTSQSPSVCHCLWVYCVAKSINLPLPLGLLCDMHTSRE